MTPCLLSRSLHLQLNHHRHHVRIWGDDDWPRLFMLHGWMDHSATFQFLAEAFTRCHQVIAPDWRGFGGSDWNSGSYYSPDYLADLDALLAHFSPRQPVHLIGHSMGGMIASLYAGIRPERVASLVSIEGFGMPDSQPANAPERYARWLEQKRSGMSFGPLTSLDMLAARMQRRQPHLTPERALWLAGQWTTTDPHGGLQYRADPRHKMVNPVLYRLEEAKACWRRIACPVLWVIGGAPEHSASAQAVFNTLDERRSCFARLSEVTIDNAGHMVQQEQPEALAKAIEDFLSGSTT
ncbi:alpha/beta fold hydrolase [Laribacter hongkongensis]|uniref:alpha/beta fold hydrolase n=1 Tax=Laribacter hongkongensis TaxID=168471 RepID=UPI001EFD3E86|nr:alpha/beta hydrolase [Laribacter hongkongensis]MCG8993507.1 alpha/beta hydrolase [Laribacter hongkongensis]MCG9002098.1 alpha/beta hydrolase [Laribacter hongkongensis]MCG9008086.1 alpha/beta hydrolase [Laribacter hongkongensis]MCG9017457.1 alpha/beta hydrolase [Laribacter hongkongensis]MCG9063574.1 alpha/beta hydrolase [Laribacter hongkongensis]